MAISAAFRLVKIPALGLKFGPGFRAPAQACLQLAATWIVELARAEIFRASMGFEFRAWVGLGL